MGEGGDPVRDQINDLVRDQISDPVRDQISDPVRDQISDLVSGSHKERDRAQDLACADKVACAGNVADHDAVPDADALDLHLKKAIELASRAHAGQVDKAGQPYILHPEAVAARCQGTAAKIVAWLHDVMEDSDIGLDELRAEGIPEVCLEALCLLCHDDAQPYEDYIRQLSTSSLAREVKLADLDHNMDQSRLPEISEKDLSRLAKYRRARELLLASERQEREEAGAERSKVEQRQPGPEAD